jgi:four helix bundle protein
MMTFEDLEGWQKARKIVHNVYNLTRGDLLCRDFGLCGQLQRAAVSIMSNVAETSREVRVWRCVRFFVLFKTATQR